MLSSYLISDCEITGNITVTDSSQDLRGDTPESFHISLLRTEYFGLATLEGNSKVETGETLLTSSPANSKISFANSYQLVDPAFVA
jgi:hypothetical protein